MKRIVTFAAALLAALCGALVPAVAASAHVTVNSPDATQGGYAVLTFRVPTESDTASTTKLQVVFPNDTPISSVSVQQHPGWAYKKELSGNTVSSVTWTASGAGTAIKPGEFDQFLVSAGPLPKVDVLRFSAIQTYSDGTVVKWDQTAVEGTAEPEHPKPSLTLAPADAKDDTAPAAAAASSDSSDTGPIVLSIVALVLAAVALGVAFVSRAKKS